MQLILTKTFVINYLVWVVFRDNKGEEGIGRHRKVGLNTFLQMQLCLLLSGIVCSDSQKSLNVSQQCLQTMFRLLGLLLLWGSRRTVSVTDALTHTPSPTRYALHRTAYY